MFKKLKEKITEEVKSSPQRLQQFTQSVSDKLQQNSVASSDENFFSIGEEDDNLEPGFSNVALMSPAQEHPPRLRRSSNSSIASDVSFLPRYESSNMYHLQSDLDASASEMEDNVSSSSQLGHLSKEQIYAAFQKSQVRYHKYRGRYTDLARHYKDLERENSKMKSVLVETQDKAIRRVTELKEQCSLEQKAKAHLESALRDDIDEKQFKIDTLQTKIELLQNNQQGPITSVNSEESMENITKYLNDARQEIEQLNSKLQEIKANLIVSQSKEQEYKTKVLGLEKEIERFAERERENNLSLAQSKMELHNEILSKEAELLNFKQDNEVLRQSLEAFETKNTSSKVENLQVQNKNLIEKLEALATKCKNQEADLLKLGQLDLMSSENAELRNKLVETEKQLSAVRDEAKKALVNFEAKVRDKLEAEFEEKRKELEKPVQNGGDFEGRVRKLEEERGKLQFEFEGKCEKYEQLEKSHLELIEEGNKLRKQMSDLEKEYAKDRSELEIKLLALTKTVEEQQGTIVKLRDANKQVEVLRDQLTAAEIDNNRLTNEIDCLQKIRDEVAAQSLSLKQKLEDLTEQNAALKEQNANLLDTSKDSAGFEGEIVKLTSKCNELRDKLTAITTSGDQVRDEMNAQIADKNSELNQLRDIESSLKAKIAKLEETMLALSAENEKLSDTKTENQELKNVVDTLRRDLATLEGQRSEQNAEIERLQSEILKTKHDEESGQALERQLRDDIDSIKLANTTLIEENQALKDDIKRIGIQLRNEIKLLQQDKQELIDENKAAENKCAKLKDDVTGQVEALEHDKKVLIEEYQSNKKELENQLGEGMETLRNQIAVLQQDKMELVEKNMASKYVEGERDQLKDEAMTLRTQLCASVEEVAKLSTEKKAMESESTKLQGQFKDEILKLQNQIEVLQGDKSKLVEDNKALKALESETAELEAQLRDEASALRNQIEALQQERVALVEESKAEAERLRDESLMLRSQIETSGEGKKKLDDENCRLMELEGQLRNEMSSLQNQLEASSQNQMKLDEEHSRLKDVESQLKYQIETLHRNNKELVTKIEEEHKARKEALDLSQSELSTRFDEVQTKLFDLEREKLILESSSEETETENKAFKLEIERLRQEVKNIEMLERNLRENQVRSDEERILLEQSQVAVDNLKRENAVLREAQSSLERLKSENDCISAQLEESKKLQLEIDELKQSVEKSSKEVETLGAQVRSLKEQNGHFQTTNAYLMDEKQKLLGELKNSTTTTSDSSSLRQELKEMERHVTELTNEKQLLQDEIQELKTAPVQVLQQENHEKFIKEIGGLRDKLAQYKSLDSTNRSSIEFYENELQKLKNQNEKINRKLDETLVTLNHCAELSNSTEIEYLKNVLYNYMLGKESLVMARVIAAVCKFDKEQTDAVLAKEQQKQSLLGQLGIL